jgi:D-Tyr-tRNAtyr deacylase
MVVANGSTAGSIGAGLCVLVGIHQNDNEEDAQKM